MRKGLPSASPSSGTPRAIGGLILVAMAGLVLAGVFMVDAYASCVLAVRGQPAEATCARVETRHHAGSAQNRRSSTIYHVTFAAAGGERVETTVKSTFRRLRVGDRLEVLYDPHKPSRAEANTFLALWWYPTLFAAVALLAAVTAAKNLRRRREHRTHEQFSAPPR